MKKFICRLLIIIVVFFALDFVYGVACAYMASHAKAGTAKRVYDIVEHITDDVVLFGSSRCIHHYDPIIMEDSLHMSTYNCGLDGQGIVYFYGIYSALCERYTPKAVIYDVSPDADLYKRKFDSEITKLKRFYDKQCVQDIYKRVSPQDYYATKLKSYQYNNIFLRLVGDNVGAMSVKNIKGYMPLSNELDINIKDVDLKKNKEVNPICMEYMERMILDCKGKTQLIFAISPFWHNTTEEDIEPLKALCAKYDVPLINHYCDTTYNFNRTLFRDLNHLNGNGAMRYSREVSVEIRQVLRERGVELPE